MRKAKSYATAGAFRTALEERLKSASSEERVDVNRLRRQVAFDRLLARLFLTAAPTWALKGGYALELRFKAARSTVDIDLTLEQVPKTAVEAGQDNQIIRDLLQASAEVDLKDWFEFNIGSPMMDLTAALPRGAANTRVKDLVDMLLLFESGALNALATGGAARLTFERRRTHEMPVSLPSPPTDWEVTFDSMARECGITKSMAGAFFEVCQLDDRIQARLN